MGPDAPRSASHVSGETSPSSPSQPWNPKSKTKPYVPPRRLSLNAHQRQKRKKISWACNHCNKAHITCDEARPCQRCIQKGLQDSCTDAPRKKKKYLGDVPVSLVKPVHKPEPGPSRQEGQASASPPSALDSVIYDFDTRNPHGLQATAFQHSASLPTYFHQPTTAAPPMPPMPPLQQPLQLSHPHPNYYGEPLDSFYPPMDNGTSHKDLYRGDLDRKRPNFASLAADMEYSTLSSILRVHNTAAGSNEETPNPSIHSPALSPPGGPVALMGSPSSLVANSYAANVFTPAGNPPHGRLPLNTRINQYTLGKTPFHQSILFPDVMQALEREAVRPISELPLSFSIAIAPEDQGSPLATGAKNPLYKAPEEIYARISKPFSYTPGYHRLIAYLRNRFPKEMLVKLAKSMAVYRPSFIACTNSLRESDLIFMEQCFQRTLLTYNDFIIISGTPTIVWRRTGELAYVGDEFCILTGWSRLQLLGSRPMFIVELLDDNSVVEYFELFSKMAFGDFLGATMTECTLLTPTASRIRTACTWTLKRDVFGIPMMIIGNFLPIM